MKIMVSHFLRVAIIMLAATIGPCAAESVVVIGHANLRYVDKESIARIYTGRQIQVGEVFVIAVNADAGSAIRTRFLEVYLRQDEGKYNGYWRVRRSVGQGKPPKEFSKTVDIINYVKSTPGAIGYIGESDIQPGLNILIR